MSKSLTESVLRGLATEALVTLFGQAKHFEAVLQPGCDLVLSNEPEHDLNVLQAGLGALAGDRFEGAVRSCLARDQPLIIVLFPEGGAELKARATELGLVHGADYPYMVRDDLPFEPCGATDVEVTALSGEADARECARILSAAFGIGIEPTLRALPAALVERPSVDGFLARREGRVVGTVHVTYHGDTAGIWAMGVDPEQHRGGIGTRLLSSAMVEARQHGARRFFLGATPAGFPLYRKLGYETRIVTQVWMPARDALQGSSV